MEFGKRHDTTDFCQRQLVDLLRTGYNGETGVIMDSGLNLVDDCGFMVVVAD